jgi:hypothetical protein
VDDLMIGFIYRIFSRQESVGIKMKRRINENLFKVVALILMTGVIFQFASFENVTAVDEVAATSITITAVDEATRNTSVNTIETNNATIRMVARFQPLNTVNQVMIWEVIGGTAIANIDRCGQLFASNNGTILVKGTSQKTPSVFDTFEVTATNQLQPIDLLTAENYTILSGTGISSGGVLVEGDIAANTANAITGFGELVVDEGGQFSKSHQVNGQVFLPTYTSPTPALLTSAINDSGTAYTTGSLIVPPTATELNAGDLSGQTLTSGVYKWSTFVTINDDLTLHGDQHDVWIFQIAGGITQLANTSIILTGGARPENIFWLTAMTVSIGISSHFEGVILSSTNITMGANSSIQGRLIAQTRVDLGVSVVVNSPK